MHKEKLLLYYPHSSVCVCVCTCGIEYYNTLFCVSIRLSCSISGCPSTKMSLLQLLIPYMTIQIQKRRKNIFFSKNTTDHHIYILLLTIPTNLAGFRVGGIKIEKSKLLRFNTCTIYIFYIERIQTRTKYILILALSLSLYLFCF